MNLSHFDESGNAVMVDVGKKDDSHRIAIAEGFISMSLETLCYLKNHSKKGDVLGVSRIAGIQGAKQTALLIPLCHPLPLTHISIDFEIEENPVGVRCIAKTETIGKTGVEMEALTAVSISLLTIYDMCKAVEKSMIISKIKLLEKQGGSSGYFIAK